MKHEISLTIHADYTRGDCLANGVPRFAHVSTGIFRISIKNVESDVSKIVGCFKFVSLRNRTSISVPLDDHCRIVHRCQCSFEMGVFAFREMLDILQRSSKSGLLGDDRIFFNHAFISRIVFEILYLFQRALMLRVANNRCPS